MEKENRRMSITVAMNNLALRHTKDSPFSHFDGTFEELCEIAVEHLEAHPTAIYEDGVCIIGLPGDNFWAGATQINEETELLSRFAPREEGEYPCIQFTANAGPKPIAEEADLVLCSKERLGRKNENSTDADWEIVSINAKSFKGAEPMHPVTMARNSQNLPGSTLTKYTPEEYDRSILHWFGGGPDAPYVRLEPC